MSAAAEIALRIGEVARLVGTTPRTIRYYEEIGLLPGGDARESGRHRVYGEREVERLREALHLKALLGLSLDELKDLLEAEDARAALRAEILRESLGHIARQLELVRRRRDAIAELEDQLTAKRRRVQRVLRELGGR
jgi:MerR family transcriptional regulator, repressor of the yfmOP operon